MFCKIDGTYVQIWIWYEYVPFVYSTISTYIDTYVYIYIYIYDRDI